MPNQFGSAYALTVLSPIINANTTGTVHTAEIRHVLDRLPQGAQSPLARIPMLHFARFAVLDDVRLQPIPAKEDHLSSKYMVFVADFDGTLDPFVDALLATASDFVTSVWQHCEGFPGTGNRAAFGAYLARCQVTTTFAFGAYATTPLPAVLRALDTQRRLMRFVRQTQGAPAATLRDSFRQFARERAAAPLPVAGLL